MARETIVKLTDDLDGSEEDVRTVRISVPYEYAVGFNGHSASSTFDVDLGPKNREALRKALLPFTTKGRFVTGYRESSLRPEEGPKIRAWAEKKGIDLKKGRIPIKIIEQYRKETD